MFCHNLNESYWKHRNSYAFYFTFSSKNTYKIKLYNLCFIFRVFFFFVVAKLFELKISLETALVFFSYIFLLSFNIARQSKNEQKKSN